MSNGVTLSLPLSATALRLGATLLADLAAHADTIRLEASPILARTTHDFGANPQLEVIVEGLAHADGLGGVQEVQPEQFGTTLEQDVETAEAAAVNPYANETPEERQFRLHGNVASAGMEPATAITQETLPPVEYEDVITGYVDGAVPFAAGHNRESYEAAGWTVDALVNAGHLQAVVERVPLVDAPGACDAPSAPAPAPAPAPNGVQLDKDGLPWDSRIHSDAAEKLSKAGVWKTRKNLPDGYKAQIEAEIRSVMNAGKPAATAEPTTQAAAAPSPTQPATTTTAAVAAPPAPSAAPAPAPSPAPVAPVAAPAGNAFAEFTRWLVGHTKAGKLSQTDAVLEIQKQGLTQIPDLAKRPDLIPAVVAALTAAKGL